MLPSWQFSVSVERKNRSLCSYCRCQAVPSRNLVQNGKGCGLCLAVLMLLVAGAPMQRALQSTTRPASPKLGTDDRPLYRRAEGENVRDGAAAHIDSMGFPYGTSMTVCTLIWMFFTAFLLTFTTNIASYPGHKGRGKYPFPHPM